MVVFGLMGVRVVVVVVVVVSSGVCVLVVVVLVVVAIGKRPLPYEIRKVVVAKGWRIHICQKYAVDPDRCEMRHPWT